VLALHDNGRWYIATLLDAWRRADGWRAVVRYSIAPRWQYVRAVSYDELRPLAADQQHNEQRDATEAHGGAGSEYDAVWPLVARDAH
jgi:hypothetical protein